MTTHKHRCDCWLLENIVTLLQGKSRNGIAFGLAWYAYSVGTFTHLPLKDRYGNHLITSARCGLCSAKFRFPFALSKIDSHLITVHKAYH